LEKSGPRERYEFAIPQGEDARGVGDAGEGGDFTNGFTRMNEHQPPLSVCVNESGGETAGSQEIQLVGRFAGLEERRAAGEAEANGFTGVELTLEKASQ
jgi:hypothetical protein